MTDRAVRPAARKRRAPERKPAAPTTPDPIEIAMEAVATNAAPDSPAQQLLVNQNRLVRWQIAGERMSAILKGLGITASLAAVVAVAALVWDAANARGVVIEAFSVPPDFADKGLTGEVVASQIQDHMIQLQASSDSQRATESFTNDWGRDIQVAIPQTGVSIGEVQRYLRRWLGNETYVNGEIFRTPAGLRLSIRANGESADPVTGSDAELEKLMNDGAWALFKKTQPYRWITANNDGPLWTDEMTEVVQALISSGPDSERAWGYNLWRNRAGDIQEERERVQRGLALDPNNYLLRSNFASLEISLGHNEAAFQHYGPALRVLQRRDRGGVSATSAENSLRGMRANIARAKGDFATALPLMQENGRSQGIRGSGATGVAAQRTSAVLLAELHRATEARDAMKLWRDDAVLTVENISGFSPRATFALQNTAIARLTEDWEGAHRQLTALKAVAANPPPDAVAGPTLKQWEAVMVDAPLAEVLARLGRIDEARALAATLPTDCYTCLLNRAHVAALGGQPDEADRWFAEALRQAPSFHRAPTQWARALLDRGDEARAIDKAKLAHRIGPKNADALEIWGEALLAQGKEGAAIGKFRQAERFAPKWGRLHLMWGKALAAQGKSADAQAKYRQAAALDLTPAERAELTRLQQGAR